MGFKSALKKNQASEDAVTIPGGAFAEGTTMAVSYMRLSLDSWYRDLSYARPRGADVLAADDSRAGGALHHRRGVQPGADQPGDHGTA